MQHFKIWICFMDDYLHKHKEYLPYDYTGNFLKLWIDEMHSKLAYDIGGISFKNTTKK